MLFKTLLLLLAFFAANAEASPLTNPDLVAANAARAGRLGASGRSLISTEDFRKLMEERERTLAEECDDLECAADGGDFTIFTGTCPDFWYDIPDGTGCDAGEARLCCGDREDCCEFTGGGIAVITSVAIVVVLLIVLCSCACCSGCPFYEKLCCADRNRK